MVRYVQAVGIHTICVMERLDNRRVCCLSRSGCIRMGKSRCMGSVGHPVGEHAVHSNSCHSSSPALWSSKSSLFKSSHELQWTSKWMKTNNRWGGKCILQCRRTGTNSQHAVSQYISTSCKTLRVLNNHPMHKNRGTDALRLSLISRSFDFDK